MDNILLLIELAKIITPFRPGFATTLEISKRSGLSQQSVSRKLRELEDLGLISRKATPEGIEIRFTNDGISELMSLNATLSSILAQKDSISGKLVSGLGQGRYYVSKYSDAIKKVSGFLPYKGTLNLKVDQDSLRHFLHMRKKHKIAGFKEKDRSYGSILIYDVKIFSDDGAIIVPERTSHQGDIVEIISPVYLRGRYSLKDNDEVIIR